VLTSGSEQKSFRRRQLQAVAEVLTKSVSKGCNFIILMNWYGLLITVSIYEFIQKVDLKFLL